jgi:hypothetical protein
VNRSRVNIAEMEESIEIGRRKVRCKGVSWIEQTYFMVQWWGFENRLMNLQIP